jgi:hypothetical protein
MWKIRRIIPHGPTPHVVGYHRGGEPVILAFTAADEATTDDPLVVEMAQHWPDFEITEMDEDDASTETPPTRHAREAAADAAEAADETSSETTPAPAGRRRTKE